jgi:site-specific recombinase XerD
LSVLYDTGARVQELIDLRVRDIRLGASAIVQLTGKGRKTRLVPLMQSTARLLAQYLREQDLLDPSRGEEWLFRNQRNRQFSRWGIGYLIKQYCDRARATCNSLPKRVTPHSLRHSKAMHLLQAGNPAVIIRDILGHADIQSTEIYAKADLEMKRKALEKAAGATPKLVIPPWHRKPDLLRWLESL